MSIEENNREISDPKTRYLVKTLSRTNRKDYENYVINAIWHRLNDAEVEVVSQQYVEDPGRRMGRSHYFIDLYFPSLNIGIECDEAFHKKQIDQDADRQITIYDVLYGVKLDSAFRLIRIDVTQSFEGLQKSIDSAVEILRQSVKEVCPPKWAVQSVEKYYASREKISTGDKKGFRSILEACNVLFNLERKPSRGASKAYFTPGAFKKSDHSLNGYKLWFPKLALKIRNDDGTTSTIAASSSGWHNLLEEEGGEINEFNEKIGDYNPDKNLRITFAKYKDPLGNNEYKFVGVFQFEEKNDKRVSYKKVANEIALIKPVMMKENSEISE